MIRSVPLNAHDVWINIEADALEKHPEWIEEFDLDDEIIEYAADRNERARVDYDRQSHTFVLIFNVPNRIKQTRHYETVPMTFIVQKHRLITISNEENAYILQRMHRNLELEPEQSLFGFLFEALYRVTDEYFPLVEEINRERDQLTRLLRDKTTRENLLALSDMETGMVYFITASKQNTVLLEQLRTLLVFRSLTEVEREQLEDTLIEARQLVEMTQLTGQTLQQLSDTYNNVLNNNLNDIFRILTTLEIILMVPTFVTGFFGMNVPVPFANHPMGWLITLIISIAGCLVINGVLKNLLARK